MKHPKNLLVQCFMGFLLILAIFLLFLAYVLLFQPAWIVAVLRYGIGTLCGVTGTCLAGYIIRVFWTFLHTK